MIQEQLEQIEHKIFANDLLSDEIRNQLLEKLHALQEELEIAQADDFDPASLQSLLGFTQLSAHEALRPQQDPQLLQLALQGVEYNLELFEADHPKLINLLNSFCMILSDMGI
ncbi:MAG: DUF4404 family protein [Immundisolibacteraceae bacterium]|nr:DUF4404 family protein [Immundisolibacteraceae bacterium]